jgi:hypothetical protein
MSLNVFLAFCILGVDFMIYALFQWTYGDKRRALARQIAAHKNGLREQSQRLSSSLHKRLLWDSKSCPTASASASLRATRETPGQAAPTMNESPDPILTRPAPCFRHLLQPTVRLHGSPNSRF